LIERISISVESIGKVHGSFGPADAIGQVRGAASWGERMLYLNEHEVGFDPDGIGFPSISGCHAIVYVTDKGLFGYHNAGGSANDKWAVRAGAFAQYYNGHFLRGGSGRRLYGTSYVDGNRGYSLPAQTSWKGELLEFAGQLAYGGKIRGFNLSKSGVASSAYVEYRKVGEKCEIWIKHWSDADRTLGAVASRLNHKIVVTRGGVDVTIEDVPRQVVTAVATAGLQHVHSERLRG
jgi:hypothetical protein